MGKNKDFTLSNNPAMNFISEEGKKTDSKKKTEPKATKPKEKKPTGKAKAPEGYKPNPEYIETKSKRVQVLLQPSLHEEVKDISKKLGISVNDFIHRAIHEASYNDYVRGLIEKDIKEER